MTERPAGTLAMIHHNSVIPVNAKGIDHSACRTGQLNYYSAPTFSTLTTLLQLSCTADTVREGCAVRCALRFFSAPFSSWVCPKDAEKLDDAKGGQLEAEASGSGATSRGLTAPVTRRSGHGRPIPKITLRCLLACSVLVDLSLLSGDA